jgi:DNA-directed RNA polymerase sigma subunit (sigma70/sigma32)
MIKGLAQYDLDEGCNVSTYIEYWIVREMINAIHNANHIVIPPASFKRIIDYKKAEKFLTQKLARTPEIPEVEKKLGLSRIQLNTLRAAFQANKRQKSLNEPRNKDDNPDEVLEDCIEGPGKDALDILEEKELKDFLRDVLCETISLSSIDKLLYRIGIVDGRHWKYSEIGDKYDIPENKVRNNVTYSLEKLRDLRGISKILIYLDGADPIIKT